jgi:hypothetical protein
MKKKYTFAFIFDNNLKSYSKRPSSGNNMRINLVCGLVVCVLSNLVIGCSFVGKVTGEQTGNAKIYVLRRLSVTGSGRIAISDNGKPVGTIDRGEMLIWNRPPGTIVVTASHGTEAKETLTVQANQVYYIEVRATHGTAEHPKVVELHVLSNIEGLHLLQTLKHEFPG